MQNGVLQPDIGSIRVPHYLPADASAVLWGRLPCATDSPVLTIDAGDARPHSVPPGQHGGNIDINVLSVGSARYLPVQAEDALASVGDPHFAQGDGEVALTAMESSLRASLHFEVLTRHDALEAFGAPVGPLVETTEYLVPTGMDEDLDEAVTACVRAAIALLQARFSLDAAHRYAYLSAATDFNISQVVDIVTSVHAKSRVADFD